MTPPDSNLFDIARDDALLDALGERRSRGGNPLDAALFDALSEWAATIDADVDALTRESAPHDIGRVSADQRRPVEVGEVRRELMHRAAVSYVPEGERGGAYSTSREHALMKQRPRHRARETLGAVVGRRSLKAGVALTAAGAALSLSGVAAAVNGGKLPPIGGMRIHLPDATSGDRTVVADVPSVRATDSPNAPAQEATGDAPSQSRAHPLLPHATGATAADVPRAASTEEGTSRTKGPPQRRAQQDEPSSSWPAASRRSGLSTSMSSTTTAATRTSAPHRMPTPAAPSAATHGTPGPHVLRSRSAVPAPPSAPVPTATRSKPAPSSSEPVVKWPSRLTALLALSHYVPPSSATPLPSQQAPTPQAPSTSPAPPTAPATTKPPSPHTSPATSPLPSSTPSSPSASSSVPPRAPFVPSSGASTAPRPSSSASSSTPATGASGSVQPGADAPGAPGTSTTPQGR